MIRLQELTAAEAGEVTRLTKSRTKEARLLERARVVALARDGKSAPAIGRELGVSEKMARQWQRRFNAEGPGGLADAPRSGRPPTYTPTVVARSSPRA